MTTLDLILSVALAVMTVFSLAGRWLFKRSMGVRQQLDNSRMLTNITHELLTPLTIISASVEKLRSHPADSHEEYDLIELNVQRSIRLLQQILDASKSQPGDSLLKVGSADVMLYIKETANSIRPLVESRQIAFTIGCAPESMMGWVDTEKLDKIIFNILSNAARLTDKGGRVGINAFTNDRYDKVTIRVSSSPTDTNHAELSLARTLTYQHKGSISSESADGQTMTVVVELPIAKEAFTTADIDDSTLTDISFPRRAIADLPADIDTRGNTLPPYNAGHEAAYSILLAEGNGELLNLMSQLLRPRYRVLTATNGTEALDVVEAHPIDLIIAEINMSGMNGLELTTQIKHHADHAHLPVILLTAKTHDDDRLKALAAGADGFITKPFRLKELQLQIDNLIANRQRIQADRQADGGREVEEIGEAPVTIDQEYLQRAIKCVNDHLSDSDYSREAFAADMGSSVSTLYNKIKSLTGKNVTTFIRDIRVKAACQLAKDNADLRVSDIAYRVGFKDPKYFATSFKRVMGIQPKEYFTQMRNDE